MSVPSYAIEIEVVEAGQCVAHQRGEKFNYPDDMGRVCPWLIDSMNGMIRVLEYGGTLPWKYAGTPYAKQTTPKGSRPSSCGVRTPLRRAS